MSSPRTFLITGGNTGIGRSTAVALAADGERVYIACRSTPAGEAAVAAIKAAADSETVWTLPLDLASLASVRSCAASFLERDEPLHVLVNNAGIGGGKPGTTADGFELHFGVNHLGHFALTQLLLERLKASGPGARIVNVSSRAHYDAPGVDFDAVRRPGSFTGMREYAVSKLCNVLFTQELARRVDTPDVCAYAVHPGVVASDIWRRVPWPARSIIKRRMLTTEQGAKTSVYCATSPAAAGESGLYYDDCQVREPSSVATPELAELLWKHSSQWTGML
ncbi:MAG TPA: SDR family oxidoreductase [Trebonia sp.]